MLAEKKQKGKKREEKAMRKRIFAAFVCLCMLMALVPSMAYANDTVYTGGLCEHHTQHDSACGYSEGAAETPCGHEHTEDCYTLVTKCVHEHTAECYSEENTELICGHVCSEESGCITKELNCNHEHDESCGYVPATAGTPCTFVCEICNAEAAEEPECICDTKCTEEEPNADCPVCGGENGDISGCVGAAMMLAPMGARTITPTKPEGNGTEENPYQIGTVDELYWFAGLVNGDESVISKDIPQNTGACAVLTKNITINENVLDENGSLNEEKSDTFEQWTPIGEDNDHEYTGTFDGQNHTISGLYVVSTGDYAGLFGTVFGGTIKNVGVVNSYISGNDDSRVGGVCGENMNGTVENSYNKGIVTVTGSNAHVGGVCGVNSFGGTIENSYNKGIVTATGSKAYIGGVCGFNNNGTIENSYNTGEVTVTEAGWHAYIGGVCGSNDGTIRNSYNTGEVTVTVTGDMTFVGGVCGYNMNGTIENSYNTGKVTVTVTVKIEGERIYVGGVCGNNYGTIKNSYNTDIVKVDDVNEYPAVGGVCGNNNGTIENSYNTGTVTGRRVYVGGVCGENGFSGEIKNCYFLTGIATSGIGVDRGTVKKVEEKDNLAFSSGEVECLLNGSQNPQPWGQGSNDMPILTSNPPEGVTDYKIMVCVDVVTPENTTKYYIAKGSNLDESEYQSGYVFFEDASYTKWIDTATKTYDVNTTIYATSPVNSITLDKTALSLYVNDTETLTATVMPVTASKTLNWSSSDDTVATVDQSGKVTAVGKGTATITAASIDGTNLKAECTVTVKKKSSGGSVFFWDLKFDTNGGSKIDTVTEWEYSTIDLDEYVPEKEGYKFVGWYADEDLTKKIDEVYLTQDTTVYAKWEKIAEEVPEEPDETEEIKETETISFKDVKESDWFYEAVSYAVENGLMSGMSEDIFAPNTPLTREMLAVVLYNVEGQPESTEANTFTDVKGDMWYTDAILWANENGIVAGYDNGAYGVGDLITREQFATILYRYAQFKGYDTTQGGMAVREFSDYENISDYARPAMAWAVNAGIMGGMDDGTLMPQGKATRAEAATILMNFCENMVEK